MPGILKTSTAAAQCLSLDVQGNVQDAKIPQISSKCCVKQLICPGPGRVRHWGAGSSQMPPFWPLFPLLCPLRRLEDNFPEALQANNGHKGHNHCSDGGRQKELGFSACGVTASPELRHSCLVHTLPQRESREAVDDKLLKYNLSFLNSYLELTSSPHPQRTVNNTFFPTPCISEMLLLG